MFCTIKLGAVIRAHILRGMYPAGDRSIIFADFSFFILLSYGQSERILFGVLASSQNALNSSLQVVQRFCWYVHVLVVAALLLAFPAVVRRPPRGWSEVCSKKRCLAVLKSEAGE